MLRAGGVDFDVRVSGVNEDEHMKGAPRAVALRTAMAKADEVAAWLSDGELVLAADTMVVVDNQIYNKPEDRREARRMLEALSGRTHTVVTAVALERAGGEALVDAVTAGVTFNFLDQELIESYLESGEADDKAGAYGIQGLGAKFVARVEGDLTCVIGLPLGRLGQMFREMTGRELFAGQTLLEIAMRAFPDLAELPAECLSGINAAG